MNTIAEEIDVLWDKHHGFRDKLRSWLDQIGETQCMAAQVKRYFHQWRPLSAYITAGAGGGKSSFRFSVRFFGQEVANLAAKNEEVYLCISKETDNRNKRYFQDLEIPAGTYKWRGKEAHKFRKYFRGISENDTVKLRSPEHKIESRIIREMRSKSRTKFNRTFSGIQPATISGFPLQFPLPISGSSGDPKPTNGHIDILARRRAGRVCLSVWELKAPRKYKNTLREVYIYSATLLKMLRDPVLGKEWYRVFGFSGGVPKALRIEAVIAITGDQKEKLDNEKKKSNLPLNIGDDSIELFAAYYHEKTLGLKFEKI